MPKIPTFTSEARPTAQVGSVKSNLQIPLSQTVAGALSPVTDFVVKKAVQANDTQNRTEALRLGNEFTRELQTIEDNIQNDSVLGVNKQAANAYYKEQTNSLISKFKGQSTNSASQTLFENNALSAVNRGIFRIDNTVEKNVLLDLTTQVETQETYLITQALYGSNQPNAEGNNRAVNAFDYATLTTNLTKLYTDAFTGKIPAPKLNEMIGNIPALVQGYQANKDIGNSPRLALQELKKGNDSTLYPNLNLDQRTQLIKDAKSILRPQITAEFKNYLTARSLGKKEDEMPRFNTNIVREVFSKPVADQIIVQKKTADDNANNVNFLNSLKNEDLDFNLEAIIKDNEETLSIDAALASNNFLTDAVANIKSKREDDPVQYILDTNSDIKSEAIKISNMSTDPDDPTKTAAQLDIVEQIVEKQEELGIPNKKVMTQNQSKQFVAMYQEAAKNSNENDLIGMMLGLAKDYGEHENLALIQLREDGLPFGTIASSILGNSTLSKMALSFDTEDEKKEMMAFVKKQNKSFETEVKTNINEGISEFTDIVRRNTNLDSSQSLTQINDIEEFLTYITAQQMIGNPGMSQEDATQFAIDSWMESFVVTDTYYIGKQQGDIRLNENETNKIEDTTDLLKTFYLDDLDIVSFKSNTETDPVILSSKMRSQMRINGEWRNTPDGEGVVFGIALDRGFAPVLNSAGEQIILKFNDRSRLVPGTDIVIDFDIGFNNPEETSATMLIDTFEKANQLARDEGITYEEALEKIRKPNIENIEFDDGKKNSKNPVNDQSSMIQTNENFEVKFAGLNNNIDEEVLGLFEYGKDKGLKGLVPNNNGMVIGKSGVTIAMGYDLGSKTLNELEAMFPKNPDIVNKLKPYLGLKGKAALDAVTTTPFTITENERETINKFATKKTLKDIESAWIKTTKNNKNAPTKSFKELPKEVATVIFSVAWQHGIDATKKFNFWTQVTTGKWDDAIKNLRDWDGTGKDSQTQSRRDKEADILEKWLNKTSKKA